jgi:hypothetical protein
MESCPYHRGKSCEHWQMVWRLGDRRAEGIKRRLTFLARKRQSMSGRACPVYSAV